MKKKKWWRYLLNIPLILLIDAVVLTISGIIDVNIFSKSEAVGHGIPAISLIASIVMAIITVVVIIRSLINIFRKEDKIKKIKEHKDNKKLLLVIPVQIIISVVVLYFSYTSEINAFYADPSNVGFCFPIVSFVLSFILIIFTILVIIIILLLTRKPD